MANPGERRAGQVPQGPTPRGGINPGMVPVGGGGGGGKGKRVKAVLSGGQASFWIQLPVLSLCKPHLQIGKRQTIYPLFLLLHRHVKSRCVQNERHPVVRLPVKFTFFDNKVVGQLLDDSKDQISK